MTFDQAIVCIQKKYRELKYQKMIKVGRLAYRFSEVPLSSREQSSESSITERGEFVLYS